MSFEASRDSWNECEQIYADQPESEITASTWGYHDVKFYMSEFFSDVYYGPSRFYSERIAQLDRLARYGSFNPSWLSENFN